MVSRPREDQETGMTRELIVRPEAETDIVQAFDWCEARVSGLGSEFLLVLDAAFNSIARNPNLYPQVHKQVRRALTRRFPFAIFFVVEDKRIVVLSIFQLGGILMYGRAELRASNQSLQPTRKDGRAFSGLAPLGRLNSLLDIGNPYHCTVSPLIMVSTCANICL